MSKSSFQKAYSELNPKQREAVDTIFGPVIVIAGPGTGKTQILALRIGNILLKSIGTTPDEILALTFTESAATTLRIRLVSFIGAAAYRVRIHTFHGFAKSILDLHPHLFPRVSEGTQLSLVRGVALIEKLLTRGSYTKIRNPKNPHHSARALLLFINKLKQEHFSPKSYRMMLQKEHKALLLVDSSSAYHTSGPYKGRQKAEYIRETQRIEKHLEVADLFAAYQDALVQEHLYDYEDLINEAIRGLEANEELRAQVGERSQFVLADEHQDANPAQNRLLELVTDFDGVPNLFIVGDEKQAIYRFQGATLASFFHFIQKYPQAKIISLKENYRSKANLIDTAHKLIAPIPVPDPSFRPHLNAKRGKGGKIQQIICDTPQRERETICGYIKKLHLSGIPYDDIALLTRKNADVLDFALFLRQNEIPEDHITADVNALSHPLVVLFTKLLQFLANLSDDESLSRALFLPGIPMPLSQRPHLLTLPRGKKSLFHVLKDESSPDMKRWLGSLEKLSEELPVTPLIPWLIRCADESGFLKSLVSLQESREAYEAYQGFMDEARVLVSEQPSATALDLLARLRLIEKHKLRIQRARIKHSGVRVMTAHAAKGLEFTHVIIPNATEENWFGGRVDEFSLDAKKQEDEDDVRRLLYVAITRARDSVLVTYSSVNDENRSQTPLRFLNEIEDFMHTEVSQFRLPIVTSYKANTIFDKNFVRECLIKNGFSPTSFNYYVQSPWQYYFKGLLNFPSPPTLPMLFGTAIHTGLKAYADHLKFKGQRQIKNAIKAFTTEINRSPIVFSEREELRKKGQETLTTYLHQMGKEIHPNNESEFLISTFIQVPNVGEIPIKGKFDRLDYHSDGTMSVIEYKTGKAKSENDIKGLTKASNGNYYRQLIFYKLLLEKDHKFKMKDAAIHFVDPDEKGRCIVRSFVVSKEETQALELELIRAAQHISDGSAFLNSCDPEECDFCDLVALLVK